MRPALVTAFGAFADVERNPSEDLLQALRERLGTEAFAGETLPVEYQTAGRRIEELIEVHRPGAVLLLGVARRAEAARFETIARNLDDCDTPDNAGCLRLGEVIDPEGPERLETTLAPAFVERVRAHGLQIELSDDAGGFLCNHVFYRARAALERLEVEAGCGFLHLPHRPLDPRWVEAGVSALSESFRLDPAAREENL